MNALDSVTEGSKWENIDDLTEEFTDSAKITYKEQARKSLDKDKLKERLGSLTDFEKVTNYKVLRIK